MTGNTVIAVCSSRRRASTQTMRGNQWWSRDVWHIQGEGKRTLCGRDASDWLTIGETEIGPDCCTRCAKLSPSPTVTAPVAG